MKPHLYLTALAAGLSFAFAGSLQGAIVYKQFQNIPIATTFTGTSVDLETGTWGDTDDLAGGDANFFWGGAGIGNDADHNLAAPTWQPIRITPGFLDPVAQVSLGDTIDASGANAGAGGVFATGYGGSGDPNPHLGNTFTAGEMTYIGFSLETGSGTAYGWMKVTLQDNQTGGFIHEWAYDDMAGSIIVGAVPEPGTAALALLALGTLAFRRKRS